MSESISHPWLLTRPAFTAAAAEEIARSAFGIRGRATELGSQQDRNFRIDSASGNRVMLKIHHPSTAPDTIEFLAAVGERLREARVPTPALIPGVSGDTRVRVVDSTGHATQATVFQFVEGESLAERGTLTGADAHRLGKLAARTVRGLADLAHPAAARQIQWNLQHAVTVVEQLVGFLPEDRRDTCRDAVADALARLSGVEVQLPRQIIHGDITSDNVMGDALGEWHLIDLGDAAHSWRIAELAIVMADVLGRTGSLALAARAVRGFSSSVSLTDAELTALWPLTVLRGAVLAVSGWSQLEVDPENEYARERVDHEWAVLEQALRFPVDQVEAQLRLASGRAHRPGVTYGELIPGLACAEMLDFSVESPLLDRGRWIDEAGAAEVNLEASTVVEAALAAGRSGSVAYARFGEARLTRVSPTSAGDAELARAERPRARCVEVWAEPGAPIRAPFAGELRVDGNRLSLTDCGVTLTISGCDTTSARAGRVEADQIIGVVECAAPLEITRQMPLASPDSAFAAFDAEYETDGACDPSPCLGLAAAEDPELRRRREHLRRSKAMASANEKYYLDPPQIERGWGALLIETRGRAYLDMVNNVAAIGHSHPRLADAVTRQLNLLNTNSRFLYAAYADFTEKLLAHAPDPSLDTVIPVNSGSEALDLAIRLAQVATGRRHILTVREGYHGWTSAADAVSTSAFDNPHALESRPEWVLLADTPNPYRGTHRGSDSAAAYVGDLRAQLGDFDRMGTPPAAFLCEPVHGNAGGVLPPEGYLAAAYAAVRAHGGLVIADEVQVGYGRLGESFWGSAMLGAVPDIIATAKAAGNAYPIGAVITRREIAEALGREGMFFSSAGGAVASAVAGSAVLDVIREERLQENAREVGAYLRKRLEALRAEHEIIGAVHGAGLYLGIELVADRASREPAARETAWVCERLLAHGVIMQATSERQNVLKVKPPMTMTRDEVDRFVLALDRVLRERTETEARH